MDYKNVLGEHKFPTYEELKNGLLRLIDEGKISPEDAARVLPELRESEDERVRKSIVETIEQCPDDFLNPKNRDKMLAYLEKQKEQKPNIELIQRSWYMEGYHDREFGKEPMWIIKTGEGGPKHELNPKYGQPLADEQKPEWSDEDIKNFNRISMILLDASEVKCWWEKSRIIEKEEMNKLTEWLKLVFNFQPLRPSWKPSEEQMKVLDEAFMKSDNEKYRQTISSLYYDLKNL